MTHTLNAFRAGLVVIIAVAVGAYFFISSRKSTLTDANSNPYFAYMTDASGINAKSLITVAGLQVGEIQAVTLTTATIGTMTHTTGALTTPTMCVGRGETTGSAEPQWFT